MICSIFMGKYNYSCWWLMQITYQSKLKVQLRLLKSILVSRLSRPSRTIQNIILQLRAPTPCSYCHSWSRRSPCVFLFLPYVVHCPLLGVPLSSSSRSSSQNLIPPLKAKLKRHQLWEDFSNTAAKMKSLPAFWDMTVCGILVCWTTCVTESLTVISYIGPKIWPLHYAFM